MKINQNDALSSSKVFLVPYEPSHVPVYHRWMQEPELQTATASEPLTLEEEYAMQKSWREDSDKLTFIVCLAMEMVGKTHLDEPANESLVSRDSVIPNAHDRAKRMIGDVNLFLFSAEDDDHDDTKAGIKGLGMPQRPDCVGVVGEIELMIAREDLRGNGLGRATLVLFMDYVLSSWQEISREYAASKGDKERPPPLEYLRVKVNHTNERSLNLFRSVGFKQIGGTNYFGEVELRWQHDLESVRGLREWEQPKRHFYRSLPA